MCVAGTKWVPSRRRLPVPTRASRVRPTDRLGGVQVAPKTTPLRRGLRECLYVLNGSPSRGAVGLFLSCSLEKDRAICACTHHRPSARSRHYGPPLLRPSRAETQASPLSGPPNHWSPSHEILSSAPLKLVTSLGALPSWLASLHEAPHWRFAQRQSESGAPPAGSLAIFVDA